MARAHRCNREVSGSCSGPTPAAELSVPHAAPEAEPPIKLAAPSAELSLLDAAPEADPPTELGAPHAAPEARPPTALSGHICPVPGQAAEDAMAATRASPTMAAHQGTAMHLYHTEIDKHFDSQMDVVPGA